MAIKYRPSPFVPSSSFSGDEASLLISAENMFLRFGRFGASVFATGYRGNLDLNEAVPVKTLAGTLAWTASSKTVTGTTTTFLADLHLGSFVFGDGGAGATVLLVVEKIVSNTSFIACVAPTTTASGKTAYVLPVLQCVGTDRATMYRGNIVQFPQGHYLGVGDGEVKINGASLSATFTLSKTPRFALYSASGGTYTQNNVGITLPTPATTTITLAAVAGTTQMRAGNYSVRVCARDNKTNGFSNPSVVIAPVTLTAGQAIRVTFNEAMITEQDSYDIYATPFKDSGTATIETTYMGPWFLVKNVTATDLIDGGHPTGREAGTLTTIFYSDAEIQLSNKILTFNNFLPKDAEFVDIINGIPIYFSCLGRGNSSALTGTSPGAVAIPSKPSNPEAVFLDKAITTAGNDIILGEFNYKARIYALCQNSLQNLILTTLEQEPITFRSLWNSGFRNPYNIAFVKDYLYGFSTQKVVRSVAGGDDSSIEFEFVTDVGEYIANWDAGQVLVGYDPNNRAMCFFYSAAERRSGYWVTIVLPFLLDKQVWNPPIVLKKSDSDFIVSGVATVGGNLEFVAGGRTLSGTIVSRTYRFDGGDSETKDWYLSWSYTDDGAEINPKTIKGVSAIGRFASANTKFKIYGVLPDGTFDLSGLQTGLNFNAEIAIGAKASLGRKRLNYMDTGSYSLYACRLEGSYTGSTADTVDRFDCLTLESNINNSKT